MSNCYRTALCLFVFALWAGCASQQDNRAQDASILPSGQERARIADSVIRSDLGYIEDQQRRLKKLNDGGIPVRNYQFAKAQCWVEFALDEYHDNDRSGVIEGALGQAQTLIAAMEQQRTVPMDTPVITGSIKIRDDLWAQAQQLKQAPGFQCAQHAVACMEVRLNDAGHKHVELGWRHAKPVIEIVEALSGEAMRLAKDCSK